MLKKIKHYINRIKQGRLKDILIELRWLYHYSRKKIKYIVIYTILGLVGIVVSLLSSLVSRDLVDIITGQKVAALLTTFCLTIGITLLSTVVSQISSLISTKISIKIDNELKAIVFDNIMNTEWESLSVYHSGDLLMRWNGDVSIISTSILSLLPNFVIYVFQWC